MDLADYSHPDCTAGLRLVAINLSRRILVPLNSVTEGIRQLAQGNLNARASTGNSSLGEATQLAEALFWQPDCNR
jgi:two-component system sensor histidine kinase AdeS